MTQRKPTPSYTAEFRARGVRLFKENRAEYASDNAAYLAIAPKLGCSRTACAAGVDKQIAMPVNDLAFPAMRRRGSRNWSARTESFAKPTRS